MCYLFTYLKNYFVHFCCWLVTNCADCIWFTSVIKLTSSPVCTHFFAADQLSGGREVTILYFLNAVEKKKGYVLTVLSSK